MDRNSPDWKPLEEHEKATMGKINFTDPKFTEDWRGVNAVATVYSFGNLEVRDNFLTWLKMHDEYKESVERLEPLTIRKVTTNFEKALPCYEMIGALSRLKDPTLKSYENFRSKLNEQTGASFDLGANKSVNNDDKAVWDECLYKTADFIHLMSKHLEMINEFTEDLKNGVAPEQPKEPLINPKARPKKW